MWLGRIRCMEGSSRPRARTNMSSFGRRLPMASGARFIGIGLKAPRWRSRSRLGNTGSSWLSAAATGKSSLYLSKAISLATRARRLKASARSAAGRMRGSMPTKEAHSQYAGRRRWPRACRTTLPHGPKLGTCRRMTGALSPGARTARFGFGAMMRSTAGGIVPHRQTLASTPIGFATWRGDRTLGSPQTPSPLAAKMARSSFGCSLRLSSIGPGRKHLSWTQPRGSSLGR
mmetsp:Transcript_8446/g.21698  ORF Transcript_8446/g.21698 Transcript_8446/m.21698 type:complete len:231 (+) Transcript_8446:326-1018(+)